jgi:transglutaminase-like putative cysteine protease
VNHGRRPRPLGRLAGRRGARRPVGPGQGAAGALALAAGFLLLLPAALHAQREYRIGPAAAWVRPVAADLGPSRLGRESTAGYELLLVDRQEAVRDAGLERYRHVAYRLLDQGAVEDHSQIELTFDPTYERLTLHAAAVSRNGRTIDQLKPGRIRVVRREPGMDDHVFDGSRSLVLVLEDVRRGDVVDYSYTRSGANPVFAGHYSATASFEESVPLRDVRFRLLWPGARQLYVRHHGATPEPTVTTVGGQREYLWRAANVPPKLLDAGLPDWYDAYGEVQLDDFASWGQVAAWGEALFASPGPLPGSLTARLARIRAGHPAKDAQVLAALRYVQDDVRYVGIEIGVNSHRPNPVATVLRRGYGDCKDKAQLLVAMLRQLGIAAQPALVSTSYGSHLRDLQPTADYFDHAIVRAEVGGRAYWLDPTATYQRGGLAASAPPFGAALVLGGAGDSLTTIPREPAADPMVEVAVTFVLADVGTPVTMQVDTRYRGRAAEDARAGAHEGPLEQLQREYTEYYAEDYPGIRSLAPPRFDDDEAANVLHLRERYAIPDFWRATAGQTGHVGSFSPVELEHALPSLTAAERTMPLAVEHPTRIRYSIAAHLPGGWAIAPRTDSIATPAMRFVRAVAVEGPDLTIRYAYETLADHVEPAAAADHLDKLARARQLLTFSVTPPAAATKATWTDPREVNWPVLLIGVLAAGLALLGAVRIHRSPPPGWLRGPAPQADGVRGLGGWLILVGLGVGLSPFVLLLSLVRSAPTYTLSSWAEHTMAGAVNYHPLWAPTLLLELVGNVALVVFTCLLAWQFFRRKRWFPPLFVVIAVARVVFVWGDTLLAGAIPAVRAHGVAWTQNWTMLLTLALWVGYMFRSRRVRNTFVH